MAARRLFSAVRFLALLPVALAACSRTASRAALTVTDDWGRTVALSAPARRIVSLAPATTELVFALGFGARLVGRTTWCDYPDSARLVTDVGNGLGPNVEAVAARRPDLVLLYASEANRQALARLEALGIAVAVVRLDLTNDLFRAARLIAEAAGDPVEAHRLISAFDAALAAARPRAFAAAGPPPRIYVDVEPNPPITLGRGSFLTEIINAAGAENVFSDLAPASALVSLETIVARDPDFVLVLSYDTTRPRNLASRPGWRSLRAVREGKVVVVDGRLYGRPSPRMPLAVADLTARLAARRGPR